MRVEVSFKHPPVVETVLGVQFGRLQGLTNAHLGAFWESIRREWPKVMDAPRLDDQHEFFGNGASWGKGVQLRLTQDPSDRIQIKNESEDRMIQVQNCRFDYNWLGVRGGEYPRYSTVRPEFDQHLQQFRAFVRETGLGPLMPNQWEVTYVNHLPKGTVWNEAREWSSVFRSLPGPATVPSGLVLEGFAGSWHFEIEPQRGRLHIDVQHGRLGGPEGDEILLMKLTARGPLESSGSPEAAIDDGLNLGHEVIVTAFRNLTSHEGHEYWNREP